MLTWVAAGTRGDLGRKEVGNNSVFVGGPHGSVAPQKCRPRTLLAAKADAAIDQPLDKPLESHRHLDQPALQAGRYPVDHAAADNSLADSHRLGPLRTVGKKVRNGNCEIVIRIEQSMTVADYSVPIGVGITREGNIEAVFEADHARHRIHRGRVHSDLAVPIDGHEPKGRVDSMIDHFKI